MTKIPAKSKGFLRFQFDLAAKLRGKILPTTPHAGFIQIQRREKKMALAALKHHNQRNQFEVVRQDKRILVDIIEVEKIFSQSDHAREGKPRQIDVLSQASFVIDNNEISLHFLALPSLLMAVYHIPFKKESFALTIDQTSKETRKGMNYVRQNQIYALMLLSKREASASDLNFIMNMLGGKTIHGVAKASLDAWRTGVKLSKTDWFRIRRPLREALECSS